MKRFIVYNQQGKILRSGICQDSTFNGQTKIAGEFVMAGVVKNDNTQKIEFDGFDANGQPINPRVVDRTPQEIAKATYTSELKQVPFEKQFAHITNKQWQDILDRLKNLEKRSAKNDE